jgi:Glycosyltransferase family 87
MADFRLRLTDKQSVRVIRSAGGAVMEDESSRRSHLLGPDSPAAGSAWKISGVGLRSLSEARLWVLGVFLMVGFTIWGYTCVAPTGRIVPGHTEWHRTDFTVFTEAGAAFFDGRNPYRVANPRGWHYLYPPLFALLVAPLSLFDTQSQVAFWYAVNVAVTFGCFGEARRLWRLSAGPPPRGFPWLGFCAFLAVVLPFLDCMQAGQLGIGILYLLMLGSRLVLQGKSRAIWFLGGLTLSLPASIKLVPALPVVFLMGQQWLAVVIPEGGRRPWGRAITSSGGALAGAILFLLVIPGFILGWNKNIHYLDVWQKQVVTNERVGPQANFNIHSYRNQSLANGVFLLSEAIRPAAAPASTSNSGTVRDRRARIGHPIARVGIGVVLLAMLAVAVIVGRRETGLDAFTAFGLACSGMLLVSPLAWGHYFMAELPALVCVPMWLSRRGMLRAARVAAVLPVVLSWSYYLAMPYVGGVGILGLGTAAWFVGTCGLMLWAQQSVPRQASAHPRLRHPGLAVPSRPHRLARLPVPGERK